MKDEYFIRQTYAVALQSAELGFDPFSALLVQDGVVVASTSDHCIIESDPTAHAELHLIRTYCQQEKRISLEGITLYCNVEPCVMCSGAIHWAKLDRVVYGVGQQDLKKVSKGKPKPDCRHLINTGGSSIEVVGPILPEEGLAVLSAFPFKSKKERFAAHWKKD